MAVETVTLQSMTQRMSRGETFLVLDVRGKSGFQNWQIKGQSVQAVNIPFFDFQENEVNDALAFEQTHVVFLNAEEPTASKVAQRFLAKGFRVSQLLGGFLEWRNLYLHSTVAVSPTLKLVQVNRVGTGCLSYVLITGHEAVVVDPTRHAEEYLRLIERENVKLTHIVDTRVHGDHISGAPTLLAATSAEYHMPVGTLHAHGRPVSLLKRGTVHFGAVDTQVIVLDTEGETGGDALLLVDGRYLLCGDAIAVGEVGIPDLFGSAQEWADKLFNTVLRELKNASDDVLVLPAHYADIQAVNQGGFVGALLGDIRLGAEAMAKGKTLTFKDRPPGFVASLPAVDDVIRRVNAGLETSGVEEFDGFS